MLNNFFGQCKDFLIKAVQKLKGAEKRILLANIAKEYGRGGQSFVAKEFNVGRDTIRLGLNELRTGIKSEDAFNMRGRKTIEEILPNLVADIKEIVEPQCQTDPKFTSTRLYTRLTITKIRNLLIDEKGYKDEELPTKQALNRVVNDLGYKMKRVLKVKPIKKIPETNAIFENLKAIHEEVKDMDNVARLSIDAKDRVKIGEFSRGGRSRVSRKASDHDFGDEYFTPFGIMDVKADTVDICLVESKVTADFIADQLEEYWYKHNLSEINNILLLNSDNGPENSSSRTQFIKRMVEFSARANIEIILAYYPPYHSKYNPIERVWGILEKHWNGDILDSKDTIFEFIKTMTRNGKNPNVTISDKIYETGIKLKKKTMKLYESALERADKIGKWFVSIKPEKAKKVVKLALLT